jgi:hypothetical protein
MFLNIIIESRQVFRGTEFENHCYGASLFVELDPVSIPQMIHEAAVKF